MASTISAVNDKFTVEDIALKVSQALSLDATNRELGRSIIREALESADVAAFAERTSSYGSLDREFVETLYEGIVRADDRLRRSAAAKAAQAKQAPADPNAPASLPFSRTFAGGAKETLGAGASSASGQPLQMRAGLILPPSKQKQGGRHVFAKPEAKESQLGLRELAVKKRAEAAAEAKASNASRLSFDEDEEDEEGGGSGGARGGATKRPKTGESKRLRRRSAGAMTPGSGDSAVNAAAKAAIDRRNQRDRERGALRPDSGRDRGRDRDRDRNRDRSRDRDRDRDRRDRHPPRGGRERGDNRWEEPSPSHGSDVWTESSRRPSSSARQGATPLRPEEREGGDSLGRGRADETPMSTPSYHYNSWAANRKKSGQTPSTGGGGGGAGAKDRRSTGKPADLDDGGEGGADAEMSESDREQWEAEQTRLDRSWYDMEEGGAQEDANPFMMSDSKVAEKEAQRSRDGKVARPGVSERRAGLNEDRDRWEENRLIGSGVVTSTGAAQTNFDDSTEARTQLMVHDTKPPFLDGRTVFTKQQKMVLPVKDATAVMSQIARKGSSLLRDVREKKDQDKSRQKFWELAGSKMGNAMGMKKVEKREDPEDKMEEGEDGEMDYKAGSQYGAHMKEKSVAASTFSKTKTMKQQREFLPIYGCREELMQVIRDNQVVIIVGETGSGKTTQMTQYLHEEGYSDYGVVGCTQPRRVAAMSVAKRVSEEMDVELGEEVGYAIRFEDVTGPNTVIKYMTDGVLLRESLNEDALEQYSCIVMDEAHERSLHTDVLFGILLKLITKRRDMKLLVTSATLDSAKFGAFFGGAPQFMIPGRTFKVDKMFSKFNCEDYVEAAVKQALQIHLSFPPGDILIFMTGQEDIEGTCRTIAERLEVLDNPPPVALLPIYSQLPSDMQAKIFEEAPDGARKCIVSTNIAETSLTIDGILYVIDSGYCKLKMYNPRIGMDSLNVTPISQANANQRAGRAGRTGPGYAYRMYTESSYDDEMLSSTVPEIQRTNLATVVLLLKTLGVDDLLAFDFMDPPPQDNILNSMYQLWILGALDNTGKLTPAGKQMSEFPLDPPLSRMVITGEKLKCSDEIITIVSMLSVPTVFFRPKDREEESDAAREKFFVPESDHLTLLHAYGQWKNAKYSSSWCTKHFINFKARPLPSPLLANVQMRLPVL